MHQPVRHSGKRTDRYLNEDDSFSLGQSSFGCSRCLVGGRSRWPSVGSSWFEKSRSYAAANDPARRNASRTVSSSQVSWSSSSSEKSRSTERQSHGFVLTFVSGKEQTFPLCRIKSNKTTLKSTHLYVYFLNGSQQTFVLVDGHGLIEEEENRK